MSLEARQVSTCFILSCLFVWDDAGVLLLSPAQTKEYLSFYEKRKNKSSSPLPKKYLFWCTWHFSVSVTHNVTANTFFNTNVLAFTKFCNSWTAALITIRERQTMTWLCFDCSYCQHTCEKCPVMTVFWVSMRLYDKCYRIRILHNRDLTLASPIQQNKIIHPFI